jgi:hypothetical protein
MCIVQTNDHHGKVQTSQAISQTYPIHLFITELFTRPIISFNLCTRSSIMILAAWKVKNMMAEDSFRGIPMVRSGARWIIPHM